MMSSSFTIPFDLDKLLAPIDAAQPTGSDLRDDASPNSLYYTLKSTRAQARSLERQALVDDEAPATPGGDWKQILDTALDILTSRSKDLEVVAWLLEALPRLYGFSGLHAGFALTRHLIERYWDGLYPLPDEDGLSTRIAPLIGLNGVEGEGTLITPILHIPLTDDKEAGPFATWQCRQAFEVDRISDPEQKRQRLEDGALSVEELQAAIRSTDAGAFRERHTALNACIDEYQQLQAAIDRACGDESQPTSRIRNALEQCAETLRFIAGDALIEHNDEDVTVEDPPAEDGSSQGASPAPSPGANVTNRRQALKLLDQAATYFRGAEPHSPISYLLDQAIRWSALSLPELLQELIEDQDARKNYCKLAGIKPAQEE